jgi:hypothetical protein
MRFQPLVPSSRGGESFPKSLNDWLHKPTAEIKQDDDKTQQIDTKSLPNRKEPTFKDER